VSGLEGLDELEAAFVERDRAGGIKTVIVSVQIPEAVVRALAPRLQGSGVSFSEFVRRRLIG
jgi:hypothetical protein